MKVSLCVCVCVSTECLGAIFYFYRVLNYFKTNTFFTPTVYNHNFTAPTELSYLKKTEAKEMLR